MMIAEFFLLEARPDLEKDMSPKLINPHIDRSIQYHATQSYDEITQSYNGK